MSPTRPFFPRLQKAHGGKKPPCVQLKMLGFSGPYIYPNRCADASALPLFYRFGRLVCRRRARRTFHPAFLCRREQSTLCKERDSTSVFCSRLSAANRSAKHITATAPGNFIRHTKPNMIQIINLLWLNIQSRKRFGALQNMIRFVQVQDLQNVRSAHRRNHHRRNYLGR